MRRLVWEERNDFREGLGPTDSLLEQRLGQRVDFVISPRPVFPAVESGIADLERQNGIRIFHAAVEEDEESGFGILEILRSSPAVDGAVIEVDVRPPEALPEHVQAGCQGVVLNSSTPIHTKTRDWSPCQGYLEPATRGVDARYAWKYEGGGGDGIHVIDIEEGYDSSHEDLPHVLPAGGTPKFHEHGTMSLGVCCGGGTTPEGIRGIAYRADARFAQVIREWPLTRASYPLTAVAIKEVVDLNLPAGSVLLLEVHASFSSLSLPMKYDGALFPVEVAPDVRLAIEYADSRGLYVVEAAGNGGVDLDQAGVTDSTAAILAGAGDPDTLTTVPGTNFGSRVDCHGWGLGVVTAGAFNQAGPAWQDNLQRDERPGGKARCYTQSFDGTSSGAAIVAGVVACLLGVYRAHSLPWPSAKELKNLIRTTRGQGSAASQIGPRPDLRSALLKLQETAGIQLRPHHGPVP